MFYASITVLLGKYTISCLFVAMCNSWKKERRRQPRVTVQYGGSNTLVQTKHNQKHWRVRSRLFLNFHFILAAQGEQKCCKIIFQIGKMLYSLEFLLFVTVFNDYSRPSSWKETPQSSLEPWCVQDSANWSKKLRGEWWR